jgi:predicted  nucleic acid-binding Zn-ribbon protein
MPIHIYGCRTCGEVAEYLVKADQIPDGCVTCGNPELERVYNGQTFGARTSQKAQPATSPSMVRKGFLVPSHLTMAEVNEVRRKDGEVQIRTVGHTPMIGFTPFFPEDN